MQSSPTNADTLFAELLHDLPPETVPMARECTAFVRAKKVKTPAQLLRLVFFSCGLDKSLRETAGNCTLRYALSTAQSVAERLRACRPWMQARLRTMLRLPSEVVLPAGWRLVVIDARSIQAPGATGTDYRRHNSLELVALECLAVLVTDGHTGETLTHFPLRAGDVAVTDRGYAHAPGRHAAVRRGAQGIGRLNP